MENPDIKFDERLVALVRDHPMVYDSKHKEYKNKKMKEEIWKSVGQELGYLGDDCQYRWRVIRDRYVKKKKEMLRRPGVPEETIVSSWKLYYNVDEFLSPYIVHRNRLQPAYYDDNNQLIFIKEEDSGSPYVLDEGSTPPYVAFESVLDDSVDDVNSESVLGTDQRPPKLSHYNSDIQSDVSDFTRVQQNGLINLDGTLRQLPNSRKRRAIQKEDDLRIMSVVSNERQNALDEEAHFGCIVTSTLRRLPPKQRALGKLKLTELLYKLEFPEDSPIEPLLHQEHKISNTAEDEKE
ncbi:hypothetical protein SNE40_018480 [Patella caerulea]|uniref:MADF domain-containing protein n=1 Tax=Patella caerulea TaxID=87958 RepID=A0AAN8J563_PATCE